MIIQNLIGRVGPQRLLRLAFGIRPNSEFILTDEARLTRRQVLSKIEALVAGLQALGIQKGDHIATLLPANPESVYALFLPHFLGSVSIPLNPLLRENELRHILRDCRAKVVITSPKWYGTRFPELLKKLIFDLPDLQFVLVTGEFEGDGAQFLALRDVIQPGRSLEKVKTSPDDITRIAYTSGTTGWPKGVVHTRKGAWGMNLRANRTRLYWMRCLLLPFPPHHFAGMFGIFVALISGGKVILMERFNPQRMLELIQQEQVTQIGATPSVYRLILGVPGQENFDLSSVLRITFSAESCPYDLAEALNNRFGCSLENIYSTSESNLISWTTVDDPWDVAASTVGVPVPGAKIRIVDDARLDLPPGQAGEIAVQTNQMMEGYYGDPELTAQVLDADGWYYTGDVGFFDPDGYLRLVDRKKDLIIRGGENVSPKEIERFLETHPTIRRAAVVAVPHALSGEAIWAYLVLLPGTAMSEREALDYCLDQIAPFKIPQRFRCINRMPLTATGKLQKYRLREMAEQEGK